MMLLHCSQLTKSFYNKLIMDKVNFEIHSGDRIGLIGVNGCGKSTLLKIIIGQDKDYDGNLAFKDDIEIGYLPQNQKVFDGELSAGQVLLSDEKEWQQTKEQLEGLEEEMAQGHAGQELMEEYGRVMTRFQGLGGYQLLSEAELIFGRLGFDKEQWNQDFITLSGGEKTKILLGRILLKEPDLLILDEPTNHADTETMDWLADFLTQFSGAVLVVSHDRYFLDKTVNKVMELEDRNIEIYPGNYSDYRREKDRRLLEERRKYEKMRKEKKKTEKLIKRQMNWFHQAHKAAGTNDHLRRKAKKLAQRAKAYRARLERLENQDIKAPKKEDKMDLDFGDVGRLARDLVTFIDVAFSYDDQEYLFCDLSFNIQRGDTVGVIGPNGIGKTTLLKMMIGQLEPSKGDVIVNSNLQIGYFSQEMEGLNPDSTPMEILNREDVKPAQARSLLGRLQLRGDEVFGPVSNLSLGERVRIVLARLMISSPDILILDEPTNHLDISGREKMEEALKDYPGTIILISHDRYLIKSLADKLLVLEDDGVEYYQGKLTNFETAEKYRQMDDKFLLKLRLADLSQKLEDEHLDEESKEVIKKECQQIQDKLKES